MEMADRMDREELLQQYPDYRRRLVASLTRLVGRADAEDVANETLLRALDAVDGFRGGASLSTWLHRIGVNLAYDMLRRQTEGPILPPGCGLDVPEASIEDVASEAMERQQTAGCVQYLLSRLPPQQRQVLIRADILDQTALEIAQETGITQSNAKIRLHRARRALRAELEAHCDLYHWHDGTLCCAPRSQQ